jgi:hypothetical protein
MSHTTISTFGDAVVSMASSLLGAATRSRLQAHGVGQRPDFVKSVAAFFHSETQNGRRRSIT